MVRVEFEGGARGRGSRPAQGPQAGPRPPGPHLAVADLVLQEDRPPPPPPSAHAGGTPPAYFHAVGRRVQAPPPRSCVSCTPGGCAPPACRPSWSWGRCCGVQGGHVMHRGEAAARATQRRGARAAQSLAAGGACRARAAGLWSVCCARAPRAPVDADAPRLALAEVNVGGRPGGWGEALARAALTTRNVTTPSMAARSKRCLRSPHLLRRMPTLSGSRVRMSLPRLHPTTFPHTHT